MNTETNKDTNGINTEVNNFLESQDMQDYITKVAPVVNSDYETLKKKTKNGLVNAINTHIKESHLQTFNQAQFVIRNDLQLTSRARQYVTAIYSEMEMNITHMGANQIQKKTFVAQVITSKFQTYMNNITSERLSRGLTGVREHNLVK